MTVEYSDADLAGVSEDERLIFADMALEHLTAEPQRRRLFISRKSMSELHSHYRVLQNEAELSSALADRGFSVVEPELLPLQDQIDLYASAECVVSLGGSALFNTVFCAPGTKVVTIEASDYFISTHACLLSSLGLNYGIVFGEQDLTDPQPIHKRWWIDVERACAAIDAFIS
jgi:capsular polysaccharide biosynthesis protein